MAEIRIDPLTGHRSIVAVGRAERAGALSATPGLPPPPDPAEDPFGEGRESETPPEVFALRDDGSAADGPGWRVRVFENRYPALAAGAEAPPPSAYPDLFWAGAATGAHEVIVNAPDPVQSLSELSAPQVAEAVDVWRLRMRAHADAACVHVIVNEGKPAGSTIAHTHAQLYALDFVPAAIARERERFGAYATRTMGGNLLGDLLQQEVRFRERVVAIDREAVVMTAYAGRVPYQLMLVPRTPRARFEDDGPTGAALLHDALGRLARVLGASPPLNLWVRTAPQGAEHFCWRIDILPRLAQPAGFELGSGVGINVVSPERAAAELRDV